MLIVLQFPLADVRSFVSGDVKRLKKPVWSDLKPGRDFVRSFGLIRTRRRGGLTGWVSEENLCIAERALRILRTEESAAFFQRPGWRLVFRTLYVDDYASVKYELGVARTHPLPGDLPVRKALQALLDLQVRVPSGTGNAPVETKLVNAGKALATLYLHGTTRKDGWPLADANRWWVGAGAATLLVEQRAEETDPIGLNVQGVFPASKYGPQAANHLLKHEGLTYNVWSYRIDAQTGDELGQRSKARRLRIALMRINAEREALDYTLSQVRQGRLAADLQGDAGERLQAYMNEATRRLGKLEQRSNVTMHALAGALEGEEESPDAMGAFLAAVRPGLRRKLEQRLAGGAGSGAAPDATLSGAQLGELQSILVEVFTREQLTQFLRVRLDEDLDAVAGDGPRGDVVFRLIEWAERVGRTEELVRAAVDAAPRSQALRDFAAVYAGQGG